jgi:hypothetical protein
LFVGTGNPVGTVVDGCVIHLSLAAPILEIPPFVVLSGPLGSPGAGYSFKPLPVPAIPALLGVGFDLQGAMLDPGSANGLFTTTNAVSVVIQ